MTSPGDKPAHDRDIDMPLPITRKQRRRARTTRTQEIIIAVAAAGIATTAVAFHRDLIALAPLPPPAFWSLLGLLLVAAADVTVRCLRSRPVPMPTFLIVFLGGGVVVIATGLAALPLPQS